MADDGVASLLIVDDEADIRFLLRRIAEHSCGLRVAGEAASGEEAVVRWRELRPDLIVLDHRMPGMSGLEAARQILAEDPAQRIVLFSGFHDEAVERSAKEIGVAHCVPKTDIFGLIEGLSARSAPGACSSG